MDSPTGDLSTRPMRLKVLYTFDVENKNNCLARWPNLLHVQTAFVDDTTQIGIIDLKTCLQAVTSSSPELISKLGYDYTVYAYDYSEPDTPLVGQGLLSWTLASNTPLPVPDDQSSNIVTGRVTKNVLGLFTKNALETLEVKLRLTPVPSSTQNDYLDSLQKYKEVSGVIGRDFDAQAWSTFVQSNPGLMSATVPTAPAARSASPMDRTGLEAMHRMLSEATTPRELPGNQSTDSFFPGSNSRQPSRATTPALAQPFNPPPRQQASQGSRPSSRAGMQPVPHQRRESFNSGYFSGEEAFEDGPAKKRAKVMKVDWPSKSNLNIERQPDSLRVAASTASSVRIHRPIPVNPAIIQQNAASNEEPLRPPTPIPRLGKSVTRRSRKASSSLRQGLQTLLPTPAEHASRQSEPVEMPMSSPEDNRGSVSSTPANIPSSPPIINTASIPSSPALPPLPGEHENDSGFMSGNFDDLFDDDTPIDFGQFVNDKESGPSAQLSIEQNTFPTTAEPYPPVFEEGNEVVEPNPATLGPPAKPAKKVAPIKPTLPRAQTSRPASRMAMSSPKLAPAPIPRARQIEDEIRALAVLPQGVASDPVVKSALHRSNTWAGQMSDAPASDIALGEDSKPRTSIHKKRIGKEQTKARLEAAITSGELPPFCENCGTIETPAWRRAYARIFGGGYDEFETSLEEGAPVYKEIIEHNDDGTVKLFKAYKISKKPEDKDDDWLSITLCNPCGLWFHKQKCMRPPEKWNKGPKDPKEKRKRPSRPRSERTAAKRANGGNGVKGDESTPSDASSPSDGATEGADQNEIDGGSGGIDETESRDEGEPVLPPLPPKTRTSTVESKAKAPAHHLTNVVNTNGQRAVQSSPTLYRGSEADPVDVDLTPQPLRRQLFSSPGIGAASCVAVVHASVAPKPLENLPNFLRRSPRFNKVKDIQGVCKTPKGKENTPTAESGHDGLDHLFDEDEDGIQLLPTTPTPTRRSDRVLRTPSRIQHQTPDSHKPATVERTTRVLRTPKNSAGRHPAAAALLGNAKSLAEMTPFTRQIHNLLSDAATHQALTSPDGPRHGFGSGKTPKGFTPKENVDFDFPDLPSLNNSSPMSMSHHTAFAFSELTTDHLQTDFQDMLSTDVPMPSSPPPGFFGFIDTHDDGAGGLGTSNWWSEMDMSQEQQQQGNSGDVNELVRHSDSQGASMGQSVTQQELRRSPRKKVANPTPL